MSLVASTLAALAAHFSLADAVREMRHQRAHRPPPMAQAIASWYDEHGIGACGVDDVQNGYRFASLILACGTRIRICHRGCAIATMVDHGPYIAGRTFDLNVNLRERIGCGGICLVRWRLA